jgi:hypothetical protein
MSHRKGMSECQNTPVRGNEGADSSQVLKATASEVRASHLNYTA